MSRRERWSGDHSAHVKKNELKPWLKQQWCLQSKASGEFVACMEDVLRVYQRPYDARFPQVCLDESSKLLLAEIRPVVPMQPGKPQRSASEYERGGVCSLFLACEPLTGQRFVQAPPLRTRQGWAQFVRELLEVHYLTAEKRSW